MEFFQQLKNAPSQNIYLLLILGLNCSLLLPITAAYPIWFKQPNIICHNQGKSFFCNEEYACNNKNSSMTYSISRENSLSLSSTYSLICDRKKYERISISLILSGTFFGTLINFLSNIILKIERKLC